MYCGFKTFKRGLIDTLGEKSDAALMGSTDRARRKLHHQNDRYYGQMNDKRILTSIWEYFGNNQTRQ